jgi:hypothetical protein
VVIAGSDLAAATAVSFGGTPAVFTVDSATQLTAIAPAGTAGAVDVVVTTAGGSATAVGGFTYVAAPTITSMSPTSGPTAGGNTIFINGSGLLTASEVSFGGNLSTPTVVSDTGLLVTVPAAAAGGTVDLTVTTAGGTATATSAYSYVDPPAITSISPDTGPTAGGTTVTITGVAFATVTAVDFGGTPSSSVTVDSDTQITAVTPAGTAGPVDVTVTTVGGIATAVDGFSYV